MDQPGTHRVVCWEYPGQRSAVDLLPRGDGDQSIYPHFSVGDY